ncbi:glycosyltransferase family 71 protein, partial [Piromyces sp. E2]
KGIVMCTGDYHFSYARSVIDTLRNILNCTLPIEIFYIGDDDLSLENRHILSDFSNIFFTDISTFFDNNIVNLSGWAIKPFAILGSRFEEIILMDADVIFVRNPIELFDEPGYIRTGTLFYKDRTTEPNIYSLKWLKGWMNDPLPETEKLRFWNGETYHEMESGTVVIHKTKTILGLLNTCKLNEYNYRHHVVYKRVHGDKETFWMGFDMARQHY